MNKEAISRYVLTAWAIIPWTQVVLRAVAIARIEWVIRPRHDLYFMYAERDPVFQQIGHIQYWHMNLLAFSLFALALYAVAFIVRPRFPKHPWYLLVYVGGWLSHLGSVWSYSCCLMDY